MVILTAPFGQTSNRFFQHIHIDSFCRDNGINFYNRFLANMNQEYPALKQQAGNKMVDLFMKGISKFKWGNVGFDEEEQNDYYKSLILKSNILFCDGWYFRSFETTRKYKSYYQKLFNPNVDRAALNAAWLNRSNLTQKIIGVHIRRGDYEFFNDGLYFYNDNVYIDKMKQMASTLGYNCRFIIFSNDGKLAMTNYTEVFDDVRLSQNVVSTDHYLMSKCDYIIGPPSTFSLWASYIGEIPFYQIYSENDRIELADFKVCNG
jgi:hypothetical protein